MAQEPSEISEIFLAGFVRELIKSSKPAPQGTEPEHIPLVSYNQNKVILPTRSKSIIEMLPEFISPVRTVETKRAVLNTGTKSKVIGMSLGKNFIQSKKIQDTNIPKRSLLQLDINELPTAEKLNFLIKDPAVTEIECLGADQMLLVKKAGSIQRTKIKLSIEEVYQLIAEFSQKTKIPVIEGTFKAALNNLILTAILSETLGPRFILQKKNPFQHLVPQ